jgi:hypothetical protein
LAGLHTSTGVVIHIECLSHAATHQLWPKTIYPTQAQEPRGKLGTVKLWSFRRQTMDRNPRVSLRGGTFHLLSSPWERLFQERPYPGSGSLTRLNSRTETANLTTTSPVNQVSVLKICPGYHWFHFFAWGFSVRFIGRPFHYTTLRSVYETSMTYESTKPSRLLVLTAHHTPPVNVGSIVALVRKHFKFCIL